MEKKPKKIILERTCAHSGWTQQNIVINTHMAGHVAHHVNNPLTVIAAKAFKLSRSDNPETKKIGDTISIQADRIARYMKALRELAEEKKSAA